MAAVLVQHHRYDLSCRVAFEVELRIDNLVEELVPGVREDREGGLPCDLRLEVIALEHDLQHAETVANHIDLLVEGDGIDNVLLMFPDYPAGIRTFAERVAPLLRQRGIGALIRPGPRAAAN
jgi:alkanesulfonate monooxygenase SsuD/methylene tetrahydromethanopterin reductase-like flavin-dependent oxidoreductase (luciferase family)